MTKSRPNIERIKTQAEASTKGPLFAKENDLIGGWCVMNVDKPPSQANYKKNEYDIADFVNEENAKFIASARQDVADLIEYIKVLERECQ